jgi:hypothetical protein
MQDRITRRKLALAVLGAPAVARAAQTPSPPEDLSTAAAERVRKNSEALAKFEVPMSTEPAFQFKA